jgi:hypothetical protein
MKCKFCEKEAKKIVKGFCLACYYRNKKNGTPDYQRVRNTCSVDNCNRFVVTNGLFDSHRKMLERKGTTESSRPNDWGSRSSHPLHVYWCDLKRRETSNLCKEWQEDFWGFVGCVEERPSKNHFLRAVEIEDKVGPSNWQWVEGIGNAAMLRARSEKAKNHQRSRAKVSSAKRAEMLDAAGHQCEICGTRSSEVDCSVTGQSKTRSLCIDHDHKTGKLRGVLCVNCNSGLGHFKDDTGLLEKAISYLT